MYYSVMVSCYMCTIIAANQVEDSKQRARPTLPLVLRELLSKVASKWENIGVLLHNIIDDGALSKIQADYRGDSGDCLREMLRVWLKKVDPPPSWNLIVDALECLGEEKLAQELKERYCVCIHCDNCEYSISH